ncbi:MAG: hypothetical protein U0800_03790 [Isosphaeraceae bacterium]
MIVDVARADVEASEARLGLFHPTTQHFRAVLGESLNAWERLRAQHGTPMLDAALQQPPVATLTLSTSACPDGLVLVPIRGRTYHVEPIQGTALAPIQWRVARLSTADEEGHDGPYHACRLADRTMQCDCAEWTFRDEDRPGPGCKHLKALEALGWL